MATDLDHATFRYGPTVIEGPLEQRLTHFTPLKVTFQTGRVVQSIYTNILANIVLTRSRLRLTPAVAIAIIVQ